MKSKRVYIKIDSLKNLISNDTKQILHSLDSNNLSKEQLQKITQLSEDRLHHQIENLINGKLIRKKQRKNEFYYSLTYKGSSLMHPENSRILTLYAVSLASISITLSYVIHWMQTSSKTNILAPDRGFFEDSNTLLATTETVQQVNNPSLSPFVFIGFILFVILISITFWRYKKNKKQVL